MSQDDQDATYARLTREFFAIRNEMAAIRASLTGIGRDFVATGRYLIEGDPGTPLHDFGILAGQAEEAGRLTARYVELLSEGQGRQVAAARFSPGYPPLEFAHGD